MLCARVYEEKWVKGKRESRKELSALDTQKALERYGLERPRRSLRLLADALWTGLTRGSCERALTERKLRNPKTGEVITIRTVLHVQFTY